MAIWWFVEKGLEKEVIKTPSCPPIPEKFVFKRKEDL
jgi:Ni,Fe-hydrogenase I small subunit